MSFSPALGTTAAEQPWALFSFSSRKQAVANYFCNFAKKTAGINTGNYQESKKKKMAQWLTEERKDIMVQNKQKNMATNIWTVFCTKFKH